MIQAPILHVGERFRLRPDGPVFVVVRVNECAAYVRRECGEPRHVTIPAKVDGRGRVVTPTRELDAAIEGEPLAISPRSLVERLEEPLDTQRANELTSCPFHKRS